jgi:hypothetical protein
MFVVFIGDCYNWNSCLCFFLFEGAEIIYNLLVDSNAFKLLALLLFKAEIPTCWYTNLRIIYTVIYDYFPNLFIIIILSL